VKERTGPIQALMERATAISPTSGRLSAAQRTSLGECPPREAPARDEDNNIRSSDKDKEM
jgi:hypothetical protein